MPAQNRPKVVVAGAGGSIGSAVSHDLAKVHDVVALVGSRERLPPESETGLSLSWRFCEPFSMQEVQKAVAGCDYLIYRVSSSGMSWTAALPLRRSKISGWALYSFTQAAKKVE